ncbi:Coenzyme F420 hydrogenase/dehydrogenase, beta subunit C-terminal domain [Desulfovibrio ferrophilus]|uniref:Formate dehydrogenase n=1 Tax=Desulfovibrio ferrophilus TaxID=241368 RepID=A0A2Z6B176_9BACT|nr:Coenzyme F420 hydrogenase/dehydrogenase, beta subunit C-terminal domain [Desulfovibrio ferrophilus]BBD09215.1 formate dehydrogenase [Desulfovibrio ferrophilus]
MATTARIEVGPDGPLRAIQGLLVQLLEQNEATAVLTPRHMPLKGTVMPALISDPAEMDQADPLSPAFPLNAAKMVSRLTKGSGGKPVAAVLRPCEIRAFIELVKLNQGSMDNVLLVGVDCMGALTNIDNQQYSTQGEPKAMSELFMRQALEGQTEMSGFTVAKACQACEHPVPEGADLILGLFGSDPGKEIQLIANTARGEGILTRMNYSDAPINGARDKAISQAIAKREAFRDAMFEVTRAATDTLSGLAEHLSSCINCYNCRAACPVCYCKECVFLTDVFDYKPDQYIGWAEKHGSLKMPTDTVFFHLTRLAHMSTSCVGCGQCSNACPNNVPVMELFRTVSHKTQQAFGYMPGMNPDEAPPMTVFREDEFAEVTGGSH